MAQHDTVAPAKLMAKSVKPAILKKQPCRKVPNEASTTSAASLKLSLGLNGKFGRAKLSMLSKHSL